MLSQLFPKLQLLTNGQHGRNKYQFIHSGRSDFLSNLSQAPIKSWSNRETSVKILGTCILSWRHEILYFFENFKIN